MIVETREMLRTVLVPSKVDVWDYLPDDINQLPCIVIDRPAYEADAQLFTLTCPVIVFGSRSATVESNQRELDKLADAVTDLLNGQDFAILTLSPEVRNVAGQAYPVYVITLGVGVIKC